MIKERLVMAMIFYFSGTGNSKWVAEELADKLNCTAENIINVKDKAYTFAEGDKVGLVFPVYAWGVPQVVIEFAEKLNVNGAFTFAICTCGSEVGNTMKSLAGVIPLNSSYSIVMPNNYVIGYAVDSEEEVQRKLGNAKEKLNIISREIDQGICKSDITKGSLAFLKSGIIAPLFNKFARNTKPFFAKEDCNSCGLCEEVCPLDTIKLENGKPVWGKECYQCLACINRCPKQAIEYGKSSVGKGRYYFHNF
jgi:NAD-dependent dihydropyrimidine dehydrogenase PreA subunit